MKRFRMEFYKLRRKRIWLIIALMLLAQLAWSFWAMNSYSRNGMDVMWEYLFYQFPMLNCIIMPMIITVLASRLCDIEHKGQSFKMLYTAISPGRLYDAKYLCGAIYLAICVAGQVICIFITSKLLHFPGVFPGAHLLSYAYSTMLVNLCLLALQQGLSLRIQNQMIPFTIGIIGCFLGLTSLFFPPMIQKLFFWSYYSSLSTIQSNYDAVNHVLDLHFKTMDLHMLSITLLITILFYATGRFIFQRKEN